MNYSVYIGGEELTDYAIIPMSEQLALDDSLDQAYIQLKFTDKASAYRPFTTVVVNVTDSFSHTRQLSYFVASDNKTEIVGEGVFSHDLLCIEQSKWLERFLTGTKTVTNPLVHDYAGTAGDVYVERYYTDFPDLKTYRYDNEYKSVINKTEQSTLECVSALTWFNVGNIFNVTYPLKITTPSGVTTNYSKTDAPVLTLEKGEYTFVYSDYETVGQRWLYDTFKITVIDQLEPKPNKTITDVVNSLLATVETLRQSETPRFSFNSTQATQYASVDSPEFTLTGTLWEALRQIGTYIHSIPRLKDNVIYFDELGSDEKVATKLTDYVSNTENFDIEQFASAIDSTIQNVVNLDDLNEGSIVEPYNYGYKTPRTETGTVQITDENMFIHTTEPIEKIVKVEVGYLSNDSEAGDITPYVYEQSEYDALSSYEDNYPNAKAYAIKYTVGQNNITGLNFKLPNAISTSIFSKYAIINIIERATGKRLSSENIMKLQFRITYIPIVTTRVKQVKPYTGDLEFDSTLAYNQSAQKINSRAYGEAMKGAIARLGNPEITKVFILNDLSLIPSVGQLYDDEYYVSVVKCEYYNDIVKCSLGLSKDFNKLNEYIGINSEERFYEISEKQAENRYPIYEDYCIIGDLDDLPSVGGSIINGNGARTFACTFFKNQTIPSTVNAVKASGEGCAEVILPVVSYAIGNSLIFTFRYDDNYSAGDKVFEEHLSTLQNQIRYTDEYGEVGVLNLSYGNPSATGSLVPDDYAEAISIGNSLPSATGVTDNDWVSMFDTENDGIRLDKDNRERIIFTYQVHFVTNDRNIIIGSELGKSCCLVNQIKQWQYIGIDQVKFYVLPSQIKKFADELDLTNATEIFRPEDYEFDIFNSIGQRVIGMNLGEVVSTVNGKALAICKGNKLLIGKNMDIVNGDTINLPSFEFVRKIS